jgi:hypothetical protein
MSAFLKRFVFCLIALSFGPYAFGQFTSDITLNTRVVTAPNNQLSHKSIPDGSGGVIVVWEDHRNSGAQTNRDIYAERFNSLGIRQWGDSNGLPIAVKPTAERYFDICTDGSGGVIIVWEDYNAAFTVTVLKGQRVTNAGVKMWSDTGNVITNEGNKQLRPKLSYISPGSYYLAYETSEFNSSEVELKANKLDINGSRQWGTGVVFCSADFNQTDLDVTTASDGGFIVTWRDPRSKLTEFDIYIQKISSSGTVLWGTDGNVVNNERFEQNYQDVYPDNSGGAFIAWTDRRDSIQIDIYAQRIRANGTAVFQNNGIPICLAPESQFRPELVTDMKGGVIMVWNDFRNGPSAPFNIDIYGQRIDSLGNIKWQVNGKNICDANLSQNNQKVISDGSYGAIVTWDDRRAGTSIYDIYAQRVDSASNLLWGGDDVPISIASGNQYEPQITPTTDGAIIFFIDTRISINNYNLYIQKVKMNGSTILSAGNGSTAVNSYRLEQNYPNPFNPSTVISFAIAKEEFVKLKVYDVTGKEVATLLIEKLSMGSHSVSFNAAALTSGVYFYRLETEGFTDFKKMLLVK